MYCGEMFFVSLQLQVAVGSPVTPVKGQDDRTCVQQARQADLFAAHIWQTEIRSRVTHRQGAVGNSGFDQVLGGTLERPPNVGWDFGQHFLLKRLNGDDLSARAFLQRYLSVQPASPSILYLAMQIERDMGDSRAERDYRRQLLEEFPESAEARRVLETG